MDILTKPINIDPEAVARREAEKLAGQAKARQTIDAFDAMKKKADAEMMTGIYDAFARRNRGGK